MTCQCMGGHGPGCAFYAPFCTACGQRIEGMQDLHACPSPRFCGRCGVQVNGRSSSTRVHHLCPGAPSIAETGA